MTANDTLIQDDSLANRHRPRRLRDVIGQQDVVSILMAQNRSDDSHHQVKMFSGPSGCGKTTIARALAAFELCENPDIVLGDACGICDSCLSVIDGKRTHTDVHEHDASSNTSRKEDVERLVQRFAMVPMRGDVQVFIIDEAHGMSRQAEDALLKYIEDLAPHNRVYFLTTEPDNVPATIRGRAQHFRLQLPASADIARFLIEIATKEGWNVTSEVADLIVELTPDSEGVRAAITNLSKLAPLFSEGEVTPDVTAKALGHVSLNDAAKIADHIESGNAPSALTSITNARDHATGREVYLALERELRRRWRRQVMARQDHTITQQLLTAIVEALHTDEFLDVLVELAVARAAYSYPANVPVAEAPVPPLEVEEVEPVQPEETPPPVEVEAENSVTAPAPANDRLHAGLSSALKSMNPPPRVVISLVDQHAHVSSNGKSLVVTFPADNMTNRFTDAKYMDALRRAAASIGFTETPIVSTTK